MTQLAMILIPMLAVGALTSTSHAAKTVANINGKGSVNMEAIADDVEFGAFSAGDLFNDNTLKINANVKTDGSASGKATFVFGTDFSSLWRADVVTLECNIDTATIDEDGTIVLQGLAFEQDFAGGIVIFEEIAPFEIIIDSEGSFSLQWCLLPAFDLELNGLLKDRHNSLL